MQAKILAIFTTPSGLTLLLAFLIAGFTALAQGGQGWAADVVTILTAVGVVFHPTAMIAGRSVK